MKLTPKQIQKELDNEVQFEDFYEFYDDSYLCDDWDEPDWFYAYPIDNELCPYDW